MHILSAMDNYLFVRWETDRGSIPHWRRPFVSLLRIMWVLGIDLYHGRFTRNAMSLVYKTLQSLVPLLALSFSVLQAFGIHYRLKPMLDQVLVPFGENGELSSRIITFVENIRVGVLGAVGLIILLYTTITTFQMVENAFNDIWQVEQKKSIFYRFMLYISMLFIGPVLMVSTIGITASFTSIGFIGWMTRLAPLKVLVYLLGFLVPYFFVVAIFTILYKMIPDTRVNWRPALAGGLFAGLLWEAGQWAFTTFVATSAKYEAIYSGFAIVIVFFIWLYVSWLILLIGAAVSCYTQYPALIGIRRDGSEISIRIEEKTALAIMSVIGRDYEQGRYTWTIPGLAKQFSLPVSYVERVARKIEKAGYVVRLYKNTGAYFPAHPLDSVTVADFLEHFRGYGEGNCLDYARIPAPEVVNQAIAVARQAAGDSLSGLTLKDISLADEPGQAGGSAETGQDRGAGREGESPRQSE